MAGTFQNVTITGTPSSQAHAPKLGQVAPASTTSNNALQSVDASLTFTVPAGVPMFAVGAKVRAYSVSAPSKWIEGTVASYSGTTLGLTVTASNGSGAVTDWNFVASTMSGETAALRSMTTVGAAFLGLTTPAAARWVRVNSDGTLTQRTAAETLSDIGALGASAQAADVNPSGTAIAAALSGKVSTASLGANSGVATLDSGGKLTSSQLPDLAITTYLGTAANQSAMLALSGQKGDWCVRSDEGKNYIITGSDPTQVGSWTALSYPASPVISVAGLTGTITASGLKAALSIGISDVGGLTASLAGKEDAQTPASQAEAEAGTETAIRKWSPLRIAQAIAALGGGGGGGGFPPTSHNLGVVTGTLTLAHANGERQHVVLNGDTTIGFSDGALGDEVTLVVEWTNGVNLNFDSIRMPAFAATLLPLAVTAWRCLELRFRYMGGWWALMEMSPETIESVD